MNSSRDIHHALNQLIVSRLPLCLPPQADSARLYALGLSNFAWMYFISERAWEEQIARTNNHGDGNTRIAQILHRAYIPALHRSARLYRDLSQLNATVSEKPEGIVQNIVTHITEVAEARPHVLLAYGWILYMALFNGGRWIRKQLAKAGPEFWGTRNFEKACLSFWHFDNSRNEDDWKRDFRASVTEAGNYLTDEEVQDVVAEAKAIFHMCKSVVLELDAISSREQQSMQLFAPQSLAAVSEPFPDMQPAKGPPALSNALLRLSIHGIAAVIVAYIWLWFMS